MAANYPSRLVGLSGLASPVACSTLPPRNRKRQCSEKDSQVLERAQNALREGPRLALEPRLQRMLLHPF